MSSVYQCRGCSKIYGFHPKLKQLKKVDATTMHRYLDSTTWRCPHCDCHQDSRDLQPFLGIGGNGMLRLVTEDEIERMINPRKYEFYNQDEDAYFRFTHRV